MKPTYDEIQMAAILLTCATCGKAFYATKPVEGWRCIPCRHAEAKLRADGGGK